MPRNPFSIRPRRAGYQGLPSLDIVDFKYGINNYLVPQRIPRGSASDSLNFLTLGSKIELRHGYSLLGNTRNIGTGHINGLFTAHTWDGTEVVFRANGTKLEYLNSADPADWVEVGTNLLADEDISFSEYFSPAGAQLWVSSTNSGLYKIMTANPGSAKNIYTSGKNFKGRIQIKSNRMLLWNYLNNGQITNVPGRSSNNALQFSYIDNQIYTLTTAEVLGSGDGNNKTFTGTLAQITGVRTGFAVSVTDGVETFTDNFGGGLVGSAGGTGTINYTTGAISVTFNTAPAAASNNVTVTYQYEDSTNKGIADFTRSATRLAGEGATFLQNEGGDLLNVFSYNNVEYCVHENKAYAVTVSTDDTLATNLIYRDNLGMPNWRAGVATADGIYYLDNTDNSRQYFSVIRYNTTGQQVLPEDLSTEILDLVGYSFDKSFAIEWNQYIVFAARTNDSTENNRLFLYSKIFGSWDIIDFFCSTLSIKSGALIGGDSVTDNVYTLFANFDDDNNVPNAYWIGNIDDYGIQGLKKTRKLWLEGEIQPDQSYDIDISLDRGEFVNVGTIQGDGTYVDSGTSVEVGTNVIGQQVIGGGNVGVVTANHYLHQIRLELGKFRTIQIRFTTKGIGYVSISMYKYFDIRTHEDKIPLQYR